MLGSFQISSLVFRLYRDRQQRSQRRRQQAYLSVRLGNLSKLLLLDRLENVRRNRHLGTPWETREGKGEEYVHLESLHLCSPLCFRHKIEVSMKTNGKRRTPLSIPPGGNGKLYGIVVVPESCPRGKFPRVISRDRERIFEAYLQAAAASAKF